jgi:hypothetical protein
MAILASGRSADNSNKAYEYIEKIVHAETPERAVQVSFHGDWCLGADAPVIPQRLDRFHAEGIADSEVAGWMTRTQTPLSN